MLTRNRRRMTVMTTSVSPLMPSNAMMYSPIPLNTRMYRNTHFATAKNRFRANGFFLRIRAIVAAVSTAAMHTHMMDPHIGAGAGMCTICLLYTSDAADDLLCVDLGGRRII